MAKVAVELDLKQIESAIASLDVPEKIKLVRKLERETRRQRWDSLIAKIRERFRKNPISDAEITALSEEVRQQRYEKSLKRSNRH